MVAEQQTPRMSVEEWRQLERTSDTKHEYVDGYVYAMAGGSQAHAHVAVNILVAISARLGSGPCIAYTSDIAAQLSATRYTYPDVVISCNGDGIAKRGENEVQPRVVFEVLSESTERYDRGLKSSYYRQCQTLHEYVMVSTDYQSIEVYHRAADGWGLFREYGPGDEVELSSIGVQFPLDSAYSRTDIPTAPPADRGTLGEIPGALA